MELPVAGKQYYGSTQALLARLKEQDRIQSDEIYDWMQHHLTPEMRGQVQLSNAQQNVINGLHVMKIPIGPSAALFLTKENSLLKVWGYKWLDKQPGV